VAESMEPITTPDLAVPMRLLAAAKLGSVRLLDNMPVPA
jgi:pantothenate synthetase